MSHHDVWCVGCSTHLLFCQHAPFLRTTRTNNVLNVPTPRRRMVRQVRRPQLPGRRRAARRPAARPRVGRRDGPQRRALAGRGAARAAVGPSRARPPARDALARGRARGRARRLARARTRRRGARRRGVPTECVASQRSVPVVADEVRNGVSHHGLVTSRRRVVTVVMRCCRRALSRARVARVPARLPHAAVQGDRSSREDDDDDQTLFDA